MPVPGRHPPELLGIDLADRRDLVRAEPAELEQDVALRGRPVSHDRRAAVDKALDELDEIGAMLEHTRLELAEGRRRREPELLLLRPQPAD